jgi:perosamine synthetase
MVVTDDEALADQCRSMANQGRGDTRWLSHVRLGYNYRLDEMSAALGLSQLQRLESIVASRAQVAGWYIEVLQGMREVVRPTVADNVRMSWFVFVIRLADSFDRADRDQVIDALQARGIGCRDYFQPIHLQPFIAHALQTSRGQFPITEAVSDRTLALPFYSQMTQEDIRTVVESLSAVIAR